MSVWGALYPSLPPIVNEWAALIPLVSHLSSQQEDYLTTGEIALSGHIAVGLFPRLGFLSGVASLLRQSRTFIDYASNKGGVAASVWDVRWGSKFLVANGAASALIIRHVIETQQPNVKKMPKHCSNGNEAKSAPEHINRRGVGRQISTFFKAAADKISTGPQNRDEPPTYRPQILHVFRFNRFQRRLPIRGNLNRIAFSRRFRLAKSVLMVALAALLGSLDLYGSAAIIFACGICGVVAEAIPVQRPTGYMQNNETHDGCMLVAAHSNAAEWALYVGDRGAIDTVLNKPMVTLPHGRTAYAGMWVFQLGHLAQLASMTFVASQKGWDGVCLFVLLGLHWLALMLPFGNIANLASAWLDRESIDVKVKSFEFSGRTPMIGAVHLFSGAKGSSWMDEILVPHCRRDVWLRMLSGELPPNDSTDNVDRKIIPAVEASLAAFEILASECAEQVPC